MAKKKGQKSKKAKRTVTKGIVHILSTFNNTIVNITDPQGNTLRSSACCTEGCKEGNK